MVSRIFVRCARLRSPRRSCAPGLGVGSPAGTRSPAGPVGEVPEKTRVRRGEDRHGPRTRSLTMRNRILLTSLACGLLAIASARARADEVRTTHTTKILKRPGEQSPVVIRVSAGHEMEVLEEQGRWLKVKVEGHEGWVTRTSVESTTEAREVQRNTRNRPFVDGRSLRRGWSGDAPDDRVGEDATGGDDDAASAKDKDDGGDDVAKPKKKAAPVKVKAHHDADADDGDGDDEVAAKPKAKKHAKKHAAKHDDDGDDDGDKPKKHDDGDDDGDQAEQEPAKKMMT